MQRKINTRLGFTVPLFVAMALCLGSCDKNKKPKTLLDYTKSAKQLYTQAMEEFEDEDCAEAEKMFQDVRRQYPYSKYSVASELRMADCHFMQGNHAEAAVSFAHFVKTHPTHEEAHYAAYMRGFSFCRMIPRDWVITPPPHERDQSATRDARGALSGFLRNYPNSEWAPRAQELYVEVIDALVRHEMYVAQFYISRDKLLAASVRLEGIRGSFTNSKLVPDAMFLQATTFLKMNQIAEARRVFGEIVEFFPQHHQALRSKDYLRYLDGKAPEKNGGTNG